MNKADINNLSLIHLQLIRLILEHGNASVAAQELGLTQSGISYHMKKIRQIFNDEMFVRTKYGFTPTEKCKRIKSTIQDIILRIEDDLLNSSDFSPMNIDKEVWLVADNTICNWVPELIEQASQIAPRMVLCTRNWNQNSFNEILTGSIDYGIHVNQTSLNSLYKVDLLPCRRYFFMRHDHYLAKKGGICLRDLQDFPVVLHDLCGFNSYGQSLIEKTMKLKFPDFKIRAKIDSISEIIEVLKSSNALVYTSALAFPLEEIGTELSVLEAPSCLSDVEFTYKLYISSARYGSLESDWLISFISESFRHFACRKYHMLESLLQGKD